MLPAIALGISALGSVASFFGRQSQAKRMRAETEEQVRRMRLQQAQQLGETQALQGASGFDMGSVSLTNYLSGMAEEMRREAEWALKNGMQRASDANASSFFQFGGDIGSSLFSYGAANNWWQKPSGG